MAIIVKNTTGVSKQWGGVTISASSQYSLQTVDTIRFLSDTTFQTDLASGSAVVNDGINDLNAVNGVLHMQAYSPKQIVGATDGTYIGNVGDSLKVSTSVTSPNQYHTSKIRSDFLDTSTSITSTSTYTTVYTYSGSGYLWGIHLCSTSDAMVTKLVIDGETIFSEISLVDINNISLNGVSDGVLGGGYFLRSRDIGDLSYTVPLGIKFNSSVIISIKKKTGYSNFTFNRYLVDIQKDT